MSRPSTRPPYSLVQAGVRVLDRLGRRNGAAMPSEAVQREAINIMSMNPRERGISRTMDVVRAYRFESHSIPGKHHLVNFYGDTEHGIVDGECTCPANTTCKHLLVALTYAERDGLHLTV